jgi:xylose isomerase
MGYTLEKGEPTATSGKKEMLENILNQYITSTH